MASRFLTVVGGLNMDLIFEAKRAPEAGESLDATSLFTLPGGKGCNTAIATYRASHSKPRSRQDSNPALDIASEENIQIFMNGAVGNDAFGEELKERLNSHNINTDGVLTIPDERSGTCLVIVDSATNDSRNLGYQGANLKWRPIDSNSITCLAAGHIPDLVIAHLGIPRKTIESVLQIAREKGVDTLLNPAPAYHLGKDTYKCITHLVLNHAEASTLSGCTVENWRDAAAWFIRLGVKNVVITLGSKGAYFAMSGGVEGVVDAVKDVKIVDTTGAGDTFVGTYGADYVKQKRKGVWDIRKAVWRACMAAARTIERLGAQEAMPWLDEIE
ncbi:Ribokinase-like protein [Lojkania enalia]|uniref:Ribokinase n=1 Tax=Lojkania enalia TaxID=147567 RepID=A0A9P4MX65_9PLEO|nr:Ribokinase-like protein [Didymosphaeria enalia]